MSDAGQRDLFGLHFSEAAPKEIGCSISAHPEKRVFSPCRLPDLAAHLSGVLFERDDAGNLTEEVYEYDTPE